MRTRAGSTKSKAAGNKKTSCGPQLAPLSVYVFTSLVQHYRYKLQLSIYLKEKYICFCKPFEFIRGPLKEESGEYFIPLCARNLDSPQLMSQTLHCCFATIHVSNFPFPIERQFPLPSLQKYALDCGPKHWLISQNLLQYYRSIVSFCRALLNLR